MENQNETDINLIDLFFYLRSKLRLIAAVIAVCTAMGFFGSNFLMEKKYTASTRVYVLNRSGEAVTDYSDYQVSARMCKDYQLLVTGRNVTGEVIDRLVLDCNSEQLAGKITATSPQDTQFVQIEVTDSDPRRAAEIANTLQEVASLQMKDLLGMDAVSLVYEAEIPEHPSGPNVWLYTLLTAGVGLAVTLSALVLAFALDETIRSEEDVQRYLGLAVMGVIPTDKDRAVNGSVRRGQQASEVLHENR